MKVKKVEKTLVAIHEFNTTLSRINEAIGVKPNLIIQELQKQELKPTAPQIWSYVGCDGKMDTEFKLEICMPVTAPGADNDVIAFKELSEFKCISHTHNGSWSEFADVYEKLFNELREQEMVPTGNCREVYHHCDFEDQSKCITEIQIEIQ